MKPQNPKQSPADSLEQRDAELSLVAALGDRLGIKLCKQHLSLSAGGWLEIDGMSEAPLVLCEAWAHQGKPKSAQKNKVMTDAAKLIFAVKLCPNTPRLILLFGDDEAAAHFKGRSWMAQLLQASAIEIQIVELPEAIRDSIRLARKRQFR